MFNKDEKKHYLVKIIIAAIALFLIAVIFIEPKPTVQHIEKPLSQIGNAQ